MSKTKKISFEEKVKSMKFSEIMKAMIDGLEKPVVEVNMATYGIHVNGVCYGCAATNAICKIGKIKLDKTNIESGKHSEALNVGVFFVDHFESAIDALRQGLCNRYNKTAYLIEIAPVPTEFIDVIVQLPTLTTYNYKENLIEYKKVYQQIKKAGY